MGEYGQPFESNDSAICALSTSIMTIGNCIQVRYNSNSGQTYPA